VFAFGVLRALWQENRQEPLRVPARGLAMSIWLDDLCVGSPNFEIRLPLEYLQELEQLGCIEIRPVRRRGHEVTILLSVQLEFAR
jgi:hypothetical protein